MTRATYRLAACVLAVLFLGLMTIQIMGPWQYRHEDNGAWFSAVARAHLRAGLSATRGQDFFQDRATGQLKPYLHHPPLLGLYLAGVFKLVGSDTPAVARSAMIAVHSCSFVVFALLVSQVFPASYWGRLWALMVFAISPMSVFFGKTPSHEPLGLLFVLAGVCVSFMVASGQWRRKVWLYAAGAAWVLAAFAAWHAIFCIVGFVPYLLRHRKDSAPGYAGMTLTAALGATALVGLHLVWANHGHLEPNAVPAAVHWTGMASAGSWVALLVHSLTNSLLYILEFYGYVPPILAIVWLAGVVRSYLRGRRIADRDLFVLCLSLGSWVFSLLLIRAVSAHVYHQFYLLPAIALSSAMVFETILNGAVVGRRRRTALIGVALAVLLTASGCAAILAAVYHKPYDYAVNAARGIQQQFY